MFFYRKNKSLVQNSEKHIFSCNLFEKYKYANIVSLEKNKTNILNVIELEVSSFSITHILHSEAPATTVEAQF